MVIRKSKSLLSIVFIIFFVIAKCYGQVTTIVNYDFNAGTSYSTLTPTIATNVTCTITSTEAFTLSATGAASGIHAFTSNTTAGKALGMLNSSGTNTRYFQFQLGGSDLSLYNFYQVYFQSQRAATGATVVTIAYSTNGTTYTNFPTTKNPTTGSYGECQFELSGVTALNSASNIYFRILVSGASGSGGLGIDNFQIQATKCVTPANVSAGTNQTITCASPSVILTGSTTTSGVTYSWSPGSITTATYLTSSPGTYTVKITDGLGCTATATTAVLTNTTPPNLSGITIQSTSIPTLGLNAYWPFNGNALDQSGNANNGTVLGASLAADRFGNANMAYSFNGTSNRIDVPHSSTIDMATGQDYSLSFWIKSNPGNSDAIPISKATYGSINGYEILVNSTNAGYCHSAGQLSYYVAAGANGDACANNPISNDATQWYHITGQYKSSTNQTTIYVNGVLQTDMGSSSATISNTKKLSFGGYNDASIAFFNGYLDDIRFYSRLLTPTEITALYNEPNPASVITCATPGIVLTGTSTTSGATYSWSPGGVTTPTNNISSTGTYTLKVTNPLNGCSVTAIEAVTTNTTAPNANIINTLASSVPTLGLNAYWPFNGNALDQSGNTNNGTVLGASLAADRFGNPNMAYSFNGTTSRIDVPHAAGIDMATGQDYTIAFWMKSNPGNSNATPIAKNVYGTWSGYSFYVNNTNTGYCHSPGQLSYYVAAGANGDACANNPVSNDASQWYFITGQYKSSTNQAFIYVNSVLQTDVGSSSGTLSNTKKLSFGAFNDGAGGYYNGSLDDIRFYSRLLTPTEITALYNEPNPASIITCTATSTALTGTSTTSGATYSWSPGGVTTPTNNISSTGTYTLKVTNPVNGCSTYNIASVVKKICLSASVNNFVDDYTKGNINLSITRNTPPYNIAWDGVKLPSSTVAYHALLVMGDTIPGDTNLLKSDYETIRQITGHSDLEPGRYPVTVYDQSIDSANVIGVIGSESDTVLSRGVAVTSATSSSRFAGNSIYAYGKTLNIAQTGAYTAGQSYAVLGNVIDRSKTNFIEFIIPDASKTELVGLRDRDPDITSGTTDVKNNTCFEFSAGNYTIWVNNAVSYSGTFNSNDVFGFSNDLTTGKISYYQNGIEVKAVTLSSINGTNEQLLKVLPGLGGALGGLVIIGPSIRLKDNITAAVTDVTCGNSCGGSIDATASIVLSNPTPVSYQLYLNGNIVSTINSFPTGDHALFTNLCPGLYTVKYNYNSRVYYSTDFPPIHMILPSSLSQTFEIAYMPDWINTANVTVSADKTLTKNAGNIFTWDAGAASLNYLESTDNGWIEWTSPSVDAVNGIGFSKVDHNQSITDIDYGIGYTKITFSATNIWRFYIKTYNNIMVNSMLGGMPLGTYTTGTKKFRLEKTGSTIFFKIDNAIVDMFNSVPAAGFIVDAALQTLSGTINKPRLSFGCKGLEQYTWLTKKLDGSYYTAFNRKLLFKYTEEYADKDGKLTFNIYDKYNNVVMNNTSMPVGTQPTVTYGDNRYSIDLANTAYLVTGQTMPGNEFYILEVINEKNEKWFLRFKK